MEANPSGYIGLYNAACTCAILGERDRALELLDRAVQNGRGSLAWTENDEDLANLRGDPRFAAIIERVRAANSQA